MSIRFVGRPTVTPEAERHHSLAGDEQPDATPELLIDSPNLGANLEIAGVFPNDQASLELTEISEASAALHRIAPTLAPWTEPESDRPPSEKKVWTVIVAVWTTVTVLGGAAVATIVSLIR